MVACSFAGRQLKGGLRMETPTREDPETALGAFLDRFEPDIRDGAAAAMTRLRALTPGADALIYDNYQALVLGVSPTGRPSDAILSIVVYPRRYLLYFLQGARLDDPDRLLEGKGSVGRSISLSRPEDMDRPEVAVLIRRALNEAKVPIPEGRVGRMWVQYVFPNPRPRRP